MSAYLRELEPPPLLDAPPPLYPPELLLDPPLYPPPL